jgi:hypothetical protein
MISTGGIEGYVAVRHAGAQGGEQHLVLSGMVVVQDQDHVLEIVADGLSPLGVPGFDRPNEIRDVRELGPEATVDHHHLKWIARHMSAPDLLRLIAGSPAPTDAESHESGRHSAILRLLARN